MVELCQSHYHHILSLINYYSILHCCANIKFFCSSIIIVCIVFVSECDFCGQLFFITPSVVFVNLYQITVVHIVYCVIVLIDVIGLFGFKLKRVIM